MTRDEQLRRAFEEWWASQPFTLYDSKLTGWKCFAAGANAAMDLQFEPGAVRFGEPTPEPAFPTPGTPEWAAMNAERADLIMKLVRGVATAEERARHLELQAMSSARIDAAFPLDDIGPPPTFMGKPVVFVENPSRMTEIKFGPDPDLGGEGG